MNPQDDEVKTSEERKGLVDAQTKCAPETTQEDLELEKSNRENLNTFAYLKPSPRELVKMNDLRERFAFLADVLAGALLNGRYKSLAITKLEEAAMFVNKSVTRD